MMGKSSASILVVAVLFAAGCIGPPDEPATPLDENEGTEAGPSTELPDGRGQSLGNLETNRTEEGAGGIDHKHDYWSGREQVVLFDRSVSFFPTPLYPDGEGSQPKSVAYVKLGKLPEDDAKDALVYEGADRLTVRASESELFTAPNANPPKLFLQYRSAADSEWREPIAMPLGEDVEIRMLPRETDMPHSTRSLWVFRITTDSPDASSIHLTMTVFKGREVVDWPGHPEFYAESNVRKIADEKPVKTHMSGMAEGYMYDSGGTWARPDRLISYGTSKLIVIANVTRATSEYGAPATGHFLEVHDATVIGPEVRFGDRYSEMNGNNDLQTYYFEVPVEADGMDGPYQPESRWGFRLMATFQNFATPVGGLGLCPGCFSYDIEYTLTVFAIHEEGAAGIRE